MRLVCRTNIFMHMRKPSKFTKENAKIKVDKIKVSNRVIQIAESVACRRRHSELNTFRVYECFYVSQPGMW